MQMQVPEGARKIEDGPGTVGIFIATCQAYSGQDSPIRLCVGGQWIEVTLIDHDFTSFKGVIVETGQPIYGEYDSELAQGWFKSDQTH